MLNNLLSYLAVLSQVQGSGHYVNEEIKEVIREIRVELGLDKQKKNNVKQSRFLVFEKKLEHKASFIQVCLFEAVFGDRKGEAIYYDPREALLVTIAVDVLNDMQKDYELYVHTTQSVVEVRKVT